MALNSTQIAWLVEITRESKADVISAIASQSVDADQELILSDDIDLWEAERNSVDFKLEGGRDGVKLDVEPLLAKIFYRTRKMLGFEKIPYDEDEEVMSLTEMEVGQNFG